MQVAAAWIGYTSRADVYLPSNAMAGEWATEVQEEILRLRQELREKGEEVDSLRKTMQKDRDRNYRKIRSLEDRLKRWEAQDEKVKEKERKEKEREERIIKEAKLRVRVEEERLRIRKERRYRLLDTEQKGRVL